MRERLKGVREGVNDEEREWGSVRERKGERERAQER